jgi:hypothetical protein
MRGLVRRTLIPTLLLTCLAFCQEPAVVQVAKGVNPAPRFKAIPSQDEITFTADPCVWLPTDIPHAEAASGICHFAVNLSWTMPNFTCDEAASRYRGKN